MFFRVDSCTFDIPKKYQYLQPEYRYFGMIDTFAYMTNYTVKIWYITNDTDTSYLNTNMKWFTNPNGSIYIAMQIDTYMGGETNRKFVFRFFTNTLEKNADDTVIITNDQERISQGFTTEFAPTISKIS